MSQISAPARRKHLRENLTGFAFLAPNGIGFLVFGFLPIFASLFLSFASWELITPIKWIGFRNFVGILGFHKDGASVFPNDPYFWKYLLNTFYFMIGIPLGMATSLILALLMNQKIKGINIFRTIYFMPVVSSMIACALLWRWIYHPEVGLLNMFLYLFHIKGPDWLGSMAWAKPSLIVMGVWKGAGYNMLLYLAALQGVPEELYEAARVDGANKWRQFWGITWPLLGPINFLMIIMGVIGGFQSFDVQYVMTGGGPANSTKTMVFYIYEKEFTMFQMGYAAAIAWILAAMIFVFTFLQWKSMGKKVFYV